MANGTLRYDPRTKKVQFSGAMRIADIRFSELPADLQAALQKPPHEAPVDVQGFPPTFRLAGASKLSSKPASQPTQAPRPAANADYTLIANTPEPRLQPAPQRPPTFQYTDPGLGLTLGTGFSEPDRGLHPGLKLVQFSQKVPEIGGQSPDITRNPYNFVAFAGKTPWLEERPHPDHASWAPDCHSGVIEFDAAALTPLFIPEGFPFKPGRNQEQQFLSIARHFFRLPDAEGRVRYAIPGSSLKGVLRSAVEALSNSRCGELNEDFYSRPIPYRRRVFDNVGLLQKAANGQWEVLRVKLLYVNSRDWNHQFRAPSGNQTLDYRVEQRQFKNFAMPGTGQRVTAADVLPFRANLLYAPTRNHRYSHVILQRSTQRVAFAGGVIETYTRNLDHPHYDNHRHKHGSDPQHYAQPLDERLPLREGDLVFFTLNGANQIDSFGKNVNYIWPARFSVKQLVEQYFPKQDLSLNNPLSLAERMFGFSGRHKRDDEGRPTSHPYRGKVRIETAWGSEALPRQQESSAQTHTLLRLAPLTGPATRAKSRPLYLAPKPDGTASSYDDPQPVVNGRKFYWHQKTASPVWDKHLFDPILHKDVEPQCPPPIVALNANSRFTGRIHFDNLTPAELGCLLYALEGGGDPATHALKIGKGKPRGLGSIQFTVTSIREFRPAEFYASLTAAPESPLDKTSLLAAFRQWVQKHTKDAAHLADFDQLHRIPSANSVRYYPINFSDYGWLPKPNLNPDRPNSGKYPAALPRARHLKP